MNGKERITIAMQSVADGNTSVKNGVELVVQILGDIYDEGRDLVVQSLNPKPEVTPEHCDCVNTRYCAEAWREFNKEYKLGGEG